MNAIIANVRAFGLTHLGTTPHISGTRIIDRAGADTTDVGAD